MKLSDGYARVTAVILCAGSGSRTNLGYNKMLYYTGSKTLVELTLDAFSDAGADGIVLVINPADEQKMREAAAGYDVTFAYGGKTRTESVRNGLRAAKGCDIVVIHDGARPYLTPELIRRTAESAAKHGSGIAAVRATDTVKESADGATFSASLDRSKLWNAQTPQTFDYAKICEAYGKADGTYTDDAEIWTAAGEIAYIVEGEYENVKVTTPSDLFRGVPTRTVIGTGFDVHRLTGGRKLILGGVEIPHKTGLYGHSDADVLVHAIADALLSAANLPDIGVLFPDDDPATEGIDSTVLLGKVVDKLDSLGYHIGSVSAVVMAQKPKLAPFIPSMRERLASVMRTDARKINVSATTTEGLGAVGEEKGMAASAVCLLFY